MVVLFAAFFVLQPQQHHVDSTIGEENCAGSLLSTHLSEVSGFGAWCYATCAFVQYTLDFPKHESNLTATLTTCDLSGGHCLCWKPPQLVQCVSQLLQL